MPARPVGTIVSIASLVLVAVLLCPRGVAAQEAVTVTVEWQRPLGASRLEPGVTHVQYSLDSWGNPAAVARGRYLLESAASYQNQHLMGWGADNPEPSPGVYDWASLDRRVELMRETGATMVITLCAAPDWMKGGRADTTDWARLEVAPTPEHYADFADLARQVALRYPDVRYFQVWNELKGFWNTDLNRWDYEGYTAMYNQVYDALKGVNPAIQVGGPYVVMDSWGDRAAMSHPSTVSGPYGTLDQRPLDVITYWLANSHGADFIAVDGGNTNWDKVDVTDPFTATQKFADVNSWIASQTDLPIWWAEWYAWETEKDDLREGNAVMATALARLTESGAAVALMWQPQGDENGQSFPQGLFTGTKWSGGGQATPYYATQRSFKDYFGSGATLYHTRTSSPSVQALATESALLLINTTPDPVTVDVGGQLATLEGYEVTVWRALSIPRVREVNP
jgi:hypothetical protein